MEDLVEERTIFANKIFEDVFLVPGHRAVLIIVGGRLLDSSERSSATSSARDG